MEILVTEKTVTFADIWSLYKLPERNIRNLIARGYLETVIEGDETRVTEASLSWWMARL